MEVRVLFSAQNKTQKMAQMSLFLRLLHLTFLYLYASIIGKSTRAQMYLGLLALLQVIQTTRKNLKTHSKPNEHPKKHS